MSAPTILRHIHLPGITPFSRAQALQQTLVSQFLTSKASLSTPSPLPSPQPTILTFTPTPVYTTGRREHDTLSPSQTALLKAPLYPLNRRQSGEDRNAEPEYAEIVSTLRGGQTTFHGPGQLVIYPILDLRTLWPRFPKGISVRCYVHLLESTTIAMLLQWQTKGVRTENPGVWEPNGEKKIAALGVHLRRSISSYGVGLNLTTDLRWFDRIVACGLEGKGVTSMKAMRDEAWGFTRLPKRDGRLRKLENAAEAWVNHFVTGLCGQGNAFRVQVEAEDDGLEAQVWDINFVSQEAHEREMAQKAQDLLENEEKSL